MIKGIRYYKLYYKHKRLLRAAHVNSRDIFLVSYPKSGNTWLRFILARALYPADQMDLRSIQKYFPTIYRSTPAEMNSLQSPRYIKTHAPFFNLYPRSIYIYRDYRAVVVSAWYHAQNKLAYTGSISEFIRSPLLKTFGPWDWHVSLAQKLKLERPQNILELQYEKMLSQPEIEINRILQFCSIDPIISISEIQKLTAFETLRKGESVSGSRISDASGNHFFRKGVVDSWKEVLSMEDEQFLLTKSVRTVMKKCGYEFRTDD